MNQVIHIINDIFEKNTKLQKEISTAPSFFKILHSIPN